MKAIKQIQTTKMSTARKLQLDRTTIRTLSDRDLLEVAGGCFGPIGRDVSYAC